MNILFNISSLTFLIAIITTELRQSRQSLAAASDRMSRASYAASAVHGPAHSVASSTRRTRPRSRSREQLNGTHVHSHRPGSR